MARRKLPRKPYPDFPLFPHATGQWAKKILGKLRYFGTDWREAKEKYDREKDDLHAGREPRRASENGTVSGPVTVADLVNEFLTHKRQQMDAGELTGQAWGDYHRACGHLVEAVGRGRAVASLRPADFAAVKALAAKRLGPAALAVYIQQVRMVFKFGFDAELLDVPVRYGPGFDKPPRRVLRLQRAEAGPKLVTPETAWKLLDAADPQLRAMILLGLNCGFGQTDCARLRRAELERRPGWIDSPRSKTGADRRAPLWPETIDALTAVAAVRPAPLVPENDRLVFLTPKGHPWVYFADKGTEKRGARIDAVRARFDTVRGRTGVKVPGGFYVMRHTFRTVADEVKDQPASMLIMGHTDPTISGHYREKIGDERLTSVTDHVRAWLLDGTKEK
jgi:integrase